MKTEDVLFSLVLRHIFVRMRLLSSPLFFLLGVTAMVFSHLRSNFSRSTLVMFMVVTLLSLGFVINKNWSSIILRDELIANVLRGVGRQETTTFDSPCTVNWKEFDAFLAPLGKGWYVNLLSKSNRTEREEKLLLFPPYFSCRDNVIDTEL